MGRIPKGGFLFYFFLRFELKYNRKPAGVKGLSNELMQLRKICQHPFLFDSVEDRVNPGGLVDEKIVRASGKVELLSRILPKFFATGHRVSVLCPVPYNSHRTGTHLLPNDKSNGHHVGFSHHDGMETSSSRWRDQN